MELIAISVDVVNRHTENVTADSNTMAESAEGSRRESAELVDKMENSYCNQAYRLYYTYKLNRH